MTIIERNSIFTNPFGRASITFVLIVWQCIIMLEICSCCDHWKALYWISTTESVVLTPFIAYYRRTTVTKLKTKSELHQVIQLKPLFGPKVSDRRKIDAVEATEREDRSMKMDKNRRKLTESSKVHQKGSILKWFKFTILIVIFICDVRQLPGALWQVKAFDSMRILRVRTDNFNIDEVSVGISSSIWALVIFEMIIDMHSTGFSKVALLRAQNRLDGFIWWIITSTCFK